MEPRRSADRVDPLRLTTDRLPIALQFIGPAWSEVPLFEVAIWSERRLGFCEVPNVVET